MLQALTIGFLFFVFFLMGFCTGAIGVYITIIRDRQFIFSDVRYKVIEEIKE